MKDHNQSLLKDALLNVIKKDGIEDALYEQKIKKAWDKSVGKYGAKYTEKISFSKGKLTVNLSSALFKQELMYAKTEIITKINEVLGQELVTSIRII